MSGSYASHDVEQTTKATVGAGTVTVRNEAKQKQEVAALNRDVTQAQVITKNERVGVEIYASSSAVQEVAARLEGIRARLEIQECAFLRMRFPPIATRIMACETSMRRS